MRCYPTHVPVSRYLAFLAMIDSGSAWQGCYSEGSEVKFLERLYSREVLSTDVRQPLDKVRVITILAAEWVGLFSFPEVNEKGNAARRGHD
jgi:hypothetical protein